MTDDDLEALRELPREELLALWRKQLDCAPPKGASRVMLARIIAYEQQVCIEGGLKLRMKKRLLRIASGEAPARRSPQLKPGGRLVREWNGVSHVVEIVEDGVLYRGARYPSLTAVAREITGVKWSGPRFFGLRSRTSSR